MGWRQIDDLGLGVYDTLKDTVKDFLSWDTYVGIYDFGKAMLNGDISVDDLVSALGDSAKDKIDYFAKNTKPVFTGDPTDEEVRRYGQEMGEILTLVGGSAAALKLVAKVAPKLAKKLDVNGLLDCNCFTAGTKVLTDEGGEISKTLRSEIRFSPRMKRQVR